jgi:hypothetical protein
MPETDERDREERSPSSAQGIDRLQVVLMTIAVLSVIALFAVDLYG